MQNNMLKSDESAVKSCDPSIFSRKEFIDKVVKKSAMAGTLVYGAALVDSFVAPAARAATSGTQAVSTVTKTDLGIITSTVTDFVVKTAATTVTTTVFTSSFIP